MSVKLFCLLAPLAASALFSNEGGRVRPKALRSSALPTDSALGAENQELMKSGDLEHNLEGLAEEFTSASQNLRPEGMQKMEEAVTDLAKQASDKEKGWLIGEGSPVMGSVNTIKKIVSEQMLPTIHKMHKQDQDRINKIVFEATTGSCKQIKDGSNGQAATQKTTYDARSKSHLECRTEEASLASQKASEEAAVKAAKEVKKLHCDNLKTFRETKISQAAFTQIVKRTAGESDDSYVDRTTDTFCGAGKGKPSIKVQYVEKKKLCNDATADLAKKEKQLARTTKSYNTKKSGCNAIQLQMDNAACSRASLIKDSCEGYAGCYSSQAEAYAAATKEIKAAEANRKKEFEAANRIQCLIVAFADGEVKGAEIDACKKKTYDDSKLVITYTPLPKMVTCTVPDLWPVTIAYRTKELAPLPALAKSGAVANAEAHSCAGIMAISTLSKDGSPKGCKCARISMNGVYTPGPIVKCTGCLDVSKATQKNSCPYGTKIFSPQSREDWKTFVASAAPLKAPHFIVDVTSKLDFTAKGGTMNSASAPTFQTSDGSPWWLRAAASTEPKGTYYANCFMGLKYGASWGANAENDIKFDADRCQYHSASYYCQKQRVFSTKPKDGSPKSCACTLLELKGKYSAGSLMKCENCLSVSKSTQKNSCPVGTKLWAPRNRDDWKTFLASGLSSLRAPNWIVDVTRPVNGPGCCSWSAKNYNFNSGQAQQSAWKTADGAPWWLRSSKYNEPNGDYKANCYLDLWRNPSTADDVQWNDGNCNYHSKSYYCQPEKGAAPPPSPPPAPPAALPAEAECAGLSGTSCPGVSGWHSTISLKAGDATKMCISKVASTGGTDCNSWCKKGGLDCLRAQDNKGSGCALDGNHNRKTTANNGCSQTWGNQICQCGKKR